MKRLMTMMIGVLVVVGSSACAADSHHCAKGTHWDAAKQECVSDTTPE